ncbi:hypothetical protein D3C78_1701730 [compost metagenome]
MDRGNQADQGEEDHADPLDDAHRAGLEADHMLQIQRAAHQAQAAEEGEEKQVTRGGQGHGDSEAGGKGGYGRGKPSGLSRQRAAPSP